jgi:hypothetical protein
VLLELLCLPKYSEYTSNADMSIGVWGEAPMQTNTVVHQGDRVRPHLLRTGDSDRAMQNRFSYARPGTEAEAGTISAPMRTLALAVQANLRDGPPI